MKNVQWFCVSVLAVMLFGGCSSGAAERATERLAETPTERLAERAEETPAETPTERLAEGAEERPAETPTERLAEGAEERPAETPTERLAEGAEERPAETPTERPEIVVREPKVVINSRQGPIGYSVEIADNSAEMEQGLMFRNGLERQHGMFFVYDKPAYLSFWMKNMLIPLDIIFFDEDYKIVNMQKNVQPCRIEPCSMYVSAAAAQYVLEVNAGEVDSFGLREGDQVRVFK